MVFHAKRQYKSYQSRLFLQKKYIISFNKLSGRTPLLLRPSAKNPSDATAVVTVL